nr:hypothetical protein [Tanacetum cinerariifolium]
MTTALQNLKDQKQRDESMRTMIYQVNVRAKDLVGGCYRIMLQFAKQINVAKRELAFVKQQLAVYKPACAACHYKRQRCPPDCSLAPYFPYDQYDPDQSQNFHKLFSFNNISKILTKIDQTRRQEAMRSMIYEANVRAKDPVMGCCRIIRELDQQVREAENELAFVNQHLASYKPTDYGVQNQNEMINDDEEFSLKDLNDLRAAFYIEDILDQDDHPNGCWRKDTHSCDGHLCWVMVVR